MLRVPKLRSIVTQNLQACSVEGGPATGLFSICRRGEGGRIRGKILAITKKKMAFLPSLRK